VNFLYYQKIKPRLKETGDGSPETGAPLPEREAVEGSFVQDLS